MTDPCQNANGSTNRSYHDETNLCNSDDLSCLRPRFWGIELAGFRLHGPRNHILFLRCFQKLPAACHRRCRTHEVLLWIHQRTTLHFLLCRTSGTFSSASRFHLNASYVQWPVTRGIRPKMSYCAAAFAQAMWVEKNLCSMQVFLVWMSLCMPWSCFRVLQQHPLKVLRPTIDLDGLAIRELKHQWHSTVPSDRQ